MTGGESIPVSGAGGVHEALCEPRAEVFGTGAPFVAGWASARDASGALAEQLSRAGLVDVFAGLRADVSVSGQGLVCLGSFDPATVRALAELLVRGLCVELERGLEAA